ncbi:non-ribosomal peptide synthetase [Pelosinus fermentans]|uniref:Amino acid adenylation domain protein n=1 Tax=Pelosinus fermentans JBW45 TaxID=1192197 RepID=I9NKI8_9FIRM|nr:non-ribosomal peptide synthetase [Pelosinus fermentans]AJQ25409.1 amino acid adenylation domain protein [Pelosinus fermentans JBW45]
MNAKEILDAYKSGELSMADLREKLMALEKQSVKGTLSEGQKGLWMLQKTSPDMSAYNIPLCFRIRQKLNIELFKKACVFVMRQYPILTSVIQEENGVPYQILQPSQSLFFQQEDLVMSEWDEIQNYLRKKAQEPISLEQGPLMRVHVLSCSEQDHIILINIHHIIFDGSSIMLFLTTLLEAYQQSMKGQPLVPNPASTTYNDFVEWEQKLLTGKAGEEHQAYWKNQLSGILPILELPTDYPRLPNHSFKGKTHTRYITAELGKKIKAYAKAQHVNPSIIFLGIFKAFLYQYTGQVDIIVGMPTIGRPQECFYSLIGYFINMIPLRSQVSGTQSFSNFIRELQLAMADALDHAEYPFPALVRELSLPRTLMNSPVFQVVFAYQNFLQATGLKQFQDKQQDTLSIEYIEDIHQEGEYEFQLEVFEKEDGFMLHMKYNPDLFDSSTISQMMNQYINLAGEVVSDPALTLGELAEKAIYSEENQRLIEKYNSTEEAILPTTLHQLFIEQVNRTPDKIAIMLEEKSITYRDLHEKSNQVAGYLQKQGITKNEFVGVMVPRCIETIINILGILKAGAAYVPIEPEYPQERQQYILENSNCKIVLNSNDYGEKNIAEYPKELPEVNSCIEDIAYVIYTSGSTGRPKGVVITHKAVTNTIIDINQKFNINENDKIIGLSSVCFDLSVYDIFGAFSTGALLLLVPDQKDIKNIVKVIETQNITVWNSVPAIMNLLVENLPIDFMNTSLRFVLLSGDWIPLKLPVKIKNHFVNAAVVSAGGATEASIWSIYYPITDIKEHWKSIPYGKPLANQKFYVLNREQRQCLIGVPGELYIGGIGVAEGYLNDEEKTRNSFFNHPQLGYLYRTGDYGVMHKEGHIEFLGRKDQQVKIRGYRIELGEIENQLLEHKAVKNAIVVDFTDVSKNKYLCAYIVSEQELALSELREHLTKTLPDYMIPAYFVQVEKIPLTPNGKIDRRTLPQPENMNVGTAYVAPRNEAEKKMTQIWQDVLGIERVGIEDNYLDLGGYSINAITLAFRINEEFGIEVSYDQVFKAANLKEFVRNVIKPVESTETVVNYIKFNENSIQRNIFCIPSLVPTGMVYRHLANQLEDYSFYCFDLIESGNRCKGYADIITSIQPQGPYTLAGYSIGGFLTFEVAKELERQGHEVLGIIMIDSSYLLEPLNAQEHKRLIAEAKEVLDNHISNFMDFTNIALQEKEKMKESLLKKAINYLEYYYGAINNETVTFDICLINPDIDAYADFSEEFSRKFSQEWNKKTTGRFVQYEGAGPHLSMLEPSCIEKNAKVFRQILDLLHKKNI